MMRTRALWLEKAIIDQYNDYEYLLYTIYFHGAPTLTGQKTATLLSFNKLGRNMMHSWDAHKIQLVKKLPGDCFEVKRSDKAVTVFFYNRVLLEEVLASADVQSFLKGYGYKNFKVDEALAHLKRRFGRECPHEIGVFLGYPLADVKAFASGSSDKQCLMVGYWKVYNDVSRAASVFRLYDSIRSYITTCLKMGISPVELHESIAVV